MDKMQWEEPAAFKRAMARRDGTGPNYLKSCGMGALLCAVTLAAIAYHGNLIADSWLISILVCFSFIPVVGFLISMIGQISTNKIIVSGNGITRSVAQGSGLTMMTWLWENVVCGHIGVVVLEGHTFPALLLEMDAGEEVAIGITSKTDLKLLRDLFQANGKELTEQP